MADDVGAASEPAGVFPRGRLSQNMVVPERPEGRPGTPLSRLGMSVPD